MDDRNAEDDKDENESRRHSAKSLRIKRNEIKKLEEHICDSDSCECHCQETNVREGPRRKAWGGSKHSKGRSKKTPMIPCSSSETCEYDREHGEDDEEEEVEGTQGEHPELSSLLNDLCYAKYGNNSTETTCNSPKCSGMLKNRRDFKTLRVSQRCATTADNQSTGLPASSPVEGTSRGQATSQTCDFMSGLHYAIPFLSDRLKSSLLNRLRCDSEPRDTEQETKSANTLEAEDCTIDDLSDLCDTGNSSESEIPIPHNQHLPPCCHDNQNKQVPLPCQQTNHDNLPCCHKESRSPRLEKKLPCSLDDRDKTPSGECQNGLSIPLECSFDPLCQNGDSQEYNDAGIREGISCEDHDIYHEDWGSTHGEGDEGPPCLQGSLSYDSEGWDAAILYSGDRGAGQEESIMGTVASQGMMGNSESEENEIESAVKTIAKDVGKIDFLEHVLEGGEDELSSGNSSEMIPDLFSSLSSDSCQADDEFECDCGHCIGSMPGHFENDPDLNWQTADGLESSEREDNSSPSVINVGYVLPHEEREDGVYEFTLLTPFDPEELEVMFETMVADFQDVHFVDEDEQAAPPASSSTIDSLPYNTITAQQIDDLAPCSICLASFVVMDTSSHLPCNHLFHLQCIKAWLTKSASCPVCRSRVESPTNP